MTARFDTRRELARLDDSASAAAANDPLAASDREILAAHPPTSVVAEVRRRMNSGAKPRRLPNRLQLGVGFTLVGTAAAVLLRSSSPTGEPGEVDNASSSAGPAPDVRVKGGHPALLVFRESDVEALAPLASGTNVDTHDVVQLRVVPAGLAFGAVLSIDGRGSVTLHFPERPDAPTTLPHAEAFSLPNAYEIDDAPQFERFIFVVSPRPIDVPLVLAAAARLAHRADAETAALVPMLENTMLRETTLVLRKRAEPSVDERQPPLAGGVGDRAEDARPPPPDVGSGLPRSGGIR